jgi:hypothetical protein
MKFMEMSWKFGTGFALCPMAGFAVMGVTFHVMNVTFHVMSVTFHVMQKLLKFLGVGWHEKINCY